MGDDVALAGDWVLWRDFAVRSAGFPVSGLDAFGGEGESERLRGVANDPRFREAVLWQNPAAFANVVDKIADGAPAKPSKTRQREEIVASYWQRYCAKNDTIGFFGPLAWGRVEHDGPALAARSGAVEGQRQVHLEAWGVQALAEVIDPELRIAAGPHPERDFREALEAHTDPAVRERGIRVLDQLEAARDRLAAAPPEQLPEALAALDATFTELTGRQPVRNPGRAYGARTLSYLDCMRDLDVRIGPALVADLAPALRTLFEATRWYCGELNAIAREVVERSLADNRDGALMPVLADVLAALMQPAPAINETVAELERRLTTVLTDPDPTTIGARAGVAFADHLPAWPQSLFQSVDIQLAAADPAAIEAGAYLAVIGDVHPGGCPLLQGVFAYRHPDPTAFHRTITDHAGEDVPFLLPPFGPGIIVDARGAALTPETWIHVAAMPDSRAPGRRRTWLPNELFVDGSDVTDRSGELRVPLMDLLGLPIMITAVRSFELLPDNDHSPRITIGRVVVRREGWSIPAHEIPDRAQDIAAFARDRGMPRRVFTKSPLERKPMFLDIDSPALTRILCRQARHAAADSPRARIRFTEMLPDADTCWLHDPDGNAYVSELRLVATDHTKSRSQQDHSPHPAR